MPLLICAHSFLHLHGHTHTCKVFWEDIQLPWWEWLMTPFTAQTPHNQRCWGSVSARCPVWVITPGTQLIYYPTINPAVRTCCPLQRLSVLVQTRVSVSLVFAILSLEQLDITLKRSKKKIWFGHVFLTLLAIIVLLFILYYLFYLFKEHILKHSLCLQMCSLTKMQTY